MNTNLNPNLKYFIYARKSSESEDRQVASIPSQIDELTKLSRQLNLKVIRIFREEKSAKAPGRAIFNEMLQLIHKGKADGIICWKLDRLARNPVDGGNINWMLQQGIIQHIQTHQRSYFPNDNVLMMSLEFGMANQFIRELSANTKRGYMNRVKEGWLPHKPPIGYLNNKYKEPGKKVIYKDESKFRLMRKLWNILLEKKYSVKKMKEVADKLGLRTHRGKPLSVSKVHYLLTNPFYYGYFRWGDTLYEGKHDPMITRREFDLAQAIITGRYKSKPKYRTFAYTGLIKCKECGGAVTASFKTKNQKNGNTHHYTYYHCTKKVGPSCSQPSIREDRLEKQIEEELGKISIPPEFHQWAIKYLKEEQAQEVKDQERILESQQAELTRCNQRLNRLLDLRLNGEIDSEGFKNRKNLLVEEQKRLEELIGDSNNRVGSWLDRAEQLLSFAETAQNRFQMGDLETKRQILTFLGSNLSFENGFLRVIPQPPLEMIEKIAPEVRTEYARLEPLKTSKNQMKWEVLCSQNQRWGDRRDLNPQPQGPQPCALTD